MKNQFAKVHVTQTSTMISIIVFLSIKVITQSAPKKNNSVYAFETCILENDHEKNISIKHKLMMREIYLFESIRQKNETLNSYVFEMKVIVTKKIDFVSMTNLEKVQVKIIKNQLIDRLIYLFETVKTSTVIMNFDYVNVFMKHVKEIKKSNNFFSSIQKISKNRRNQI